MRLTGKIQKYKSASGKITFYFRVIHNYWVNTKPTATKSGHATYKLIATADAIPEDKLHDPLFQIRGWANIEKVLNSLIRAGELSDANAETIRKSFARRLPRGAAPVPIANRKPLDAANERLAAGRLSFIGIAENE